VCVYCDYLATQHHTLTAWYRCSIDLLRPVPLSSDAAALQRTSSISAAISRGMLGSRSSLPVAVSEWSRLPRHCGCHLVMHPCVAPSSVTPSVLLLQYLHASTACLARHRPRLTYGNSSGCSFSRASMYGTSSGCSFPCRALHSVLHRPPSATLPVLSLLLRPLELSAHGATALPLARCLVMASGLLTFLCPAVACPLACCQHFSALATSSAATLAPCQLQLQELFHPASLLQRSPSCSHYSCARGTAVQPPSSTKPRCVSVASFQI
jgi:hypothetical protein